MKLSLKNHQQVPPQRSQDVPYLCMQPAHGTKVQYIDNKDDIEIFSTREIKGTTYCGNIITL